MINLKCYAKISNIHVRIVKLTYCRDMTYRFMLFVFLVFYALIKTTLKIGAYNYQKHNITRLKLYISPQVLSRPRRVSDAGQLGQVPGGVLRQLLPGRLPLVRGQGRPHRLWWVLYRSDLAQSVEHRTRDPRIGVSSRTESGKLSL